MSHLVCRRTACKSSEHVVCRHRDTGEMYCAKCARLINRTCQEIVVHFPFVEGDKVRLKYTNDDCKTCNNEWYIGGVYDPASDTHKGERPCPDCCNVEVVVVGNNHKGVYRVRLPDGRETDTTILNLT